MFIPVDGDPVCHDLAATEAMGGANRLKAAMTCAGLAVQHADRRRFRMAEALGRQALRNLDRAPGPGDAEEGLALLNLAAAIAGQGRRSEAITVAARAQAILADRLPAGHPHIQAAREALGHLRINL